MPIIEIDPLVAAAPIPSPSLHNNFAWTLAGNVFYGGCQWGMLSVLAKAGSPSIVGQFTFGLAVSAPVFMFTNLQLRNVQATDTNTEYRFADYFTLRLLTTLLGLIVIVTILLFAGLPSGMYLAVLLVSVSKCLECMSDATSGLLQRQEQLKRVAISLMLRGIGSVLVLSITFVYFGSLALSVAAVSGVWLGVLLLYDAPNAKALIGLNEGFFRFHRRALWRLLLLGLPLGWVGALQTLTVNIPRYFLQHYLGLAEQGIYASLAYLLALINLVVFALSQSVMTHLARVFADGERKSFLGLLTKLSMLGVMVTAVGVPVTFLVGRPLLTLVYRREYGDHVGLLALLVGTAGLSTIGSFLFCGVTAARAFRSQVPVCIAAVLVGAAGSAIFVPRWGLIGAGAGLLLSTITIVLGGVWMIRQVATELR